MNIISSGARFPLMAVSAAVLAAMSYPVSAESITTSKNFSTSTTILQGQGETGILVTKPGMVINVNNGATLTVSRPGSPAEDVVGLDLRVGSDLTVNGNFVLSSTSSSPVKNTYNTFAAILRDDAEFNGNLTEISAVSEGATAYATLINNEAVAYFKADTTRFSAQSSDASVQAVGLNVEDKSNVTFSGSTTEISAVSDTQAVAVTTWGSTLNFKANETLISSDGGHGQPSYGVLTSDSAVTFGGELTDINAKSTASPAGAWAKYSGTIYFNSDVTRITVTADNADETSDYTSAYGLGIEYGGTMTFDGSLTEITAKGEQRTVAVYGSNARYNFSAKETQISASGSGDTVTAVSLESSSLVDFAGNSTVTATGKNSVGVSLAHAGLTVLDNASLTARGEAYGINSDSSSYVWVEKDASLTTNKLVSKGTLSLESGSTLTATESADIATLESNNATVSFGKGDFTIGTLNGTGATTLVADDVSDATTIKIGTKDVALNLAATGNVNDAYATPVEAANALLEKVVVDRDKKPTESKVTVAEGNIGEALTATLTADGKLTDVKVTPNTKLDAYSSIASLGVVSWRHEMNDLQKRLGELRMSPEGTGAWARLYGSEQEYGSQNVISKSKSIQVGGDTDIGNGWKVGGAFIYTDGDVDYDAGKADSDAYSLAVYGTWMDEKGLFVDLIGKYTRMETDFKASSMSGSYENNALTLSAEAGWHFKVNDQFFVEPQAEFTVGRIMGDSFRASNGVKVKQDDTNSVIGRVGVRTGYYLPENKGTVYARLSGVYDFDGEVSSKAVSGVRSRRTSDDLGGSWVEMGVGGNYNINDKAYVYADLQKTAGGEVKENWRWNVGMRYVF